MSDEPQFISADAIALSDCGRCGHPPSWHRHDDADNVPPTDPGCLFRCLGYDCERPGPVPPSGRACGCPDYVRGPTRSLAEMAEIEPQIDCRRG